MNIEHETAWYRWRRLFSWVDFLYSEDCITLMTYEDMVKSLMELKPYLPGEEGD